MRHLTLCERTLLVGWDAADWKILNPLIDRGEMPVFAGLVERGTIADMATLEPVLSPLLWNSIATGKRADRHGILGFTEVDPDSGRVRPVSSVSRRTKALWNILSQNGIRTNVVGWFGGHPAEPIRGMCVSDAFARGFPAPGAAWPLAPGTVWPESIAGSLEALRVRPEEIDEEIFRLFVPRLEEAMQAKPNRLPLLAKLLAECITTHAAATWAMEHSEWDFMAAYYIGIDHFSHGFMNFHPPKPEWVDQRDFDLYSGVVAGAYRLMDLFLARLLQLAGPDTRVIVLSDHGFHSDHLRPSRIPRVPTGPATQHRPLGVLAMAGKGIRRDERIFGVNLLDVAPTVLALFGLPAGEDMPGRVLAEAFDEPPAIGRIPSWDLVPGECGSHPAGYKFPSDDYDRLIEQFVALGYVAPQPEDRDRAAALSRRETKWNLARVYTSQWRFEDALEPLEELAAEAPERLDFLLTLADCQLRLGLYDEAEANAALAQLAPTPVPMALAMRGRIALARSRYLESVELFLAAERAAPRIPEIYNGIGHAWLKLRRWRDAARAFEKALELDPHDPTALQGMARIRLREGRAEDAAECALAAIACRHDLPLSHFWLGIALARLGRIPRAIEALETSLSFHPPLRISHKVLATLYGATPRGEAHRREAKAFFRSRGEEQRRIEGIRQAVRRRALDRKREPVERASPIGAPLEFVVVSGLPRSGTSLMMSMLEAAGVPLQTDGRRKPDADNPEGYYEWEAIRTVGAHPEILREAEGKAVKAVSILLFALPVRHRYKVIFMDRPIAEIVASQRRMRRNRNAAEPAADSGYMTELLEAHRVEVLRGLEQSPWFEALIVDYPELVESPEAWAPRILAFLGIAATPEAIANMAGRVRPELYRNRR
jgi:predicted AlkP superfamily phosphohydrolase/phosphomutase/tetratricopeptide (TPR) repeat protein